MLQENKTEAISCNAKKTSSIIREEHQNNRHKLLNANDDITETDESNTNNINNIDNTMSQKLTYFLNPNTDILSGYTLININNDIYNYSVITENNYNRNLSYRLCEKIIFYKGLCNILKIELKIKLHENLVDLSDTLTDEADLVYDISKAGEMLKINRNILVVSLEYISKSIKKYIHNITSKNSTTESKRRKSESPDKISNYIFNYADYFIKIYFDFDRTNLNFTKNRYYTELYLDNTNFIFDKIIYKLPLYNNILFNIKDNANNSQIDYTEFKNEININKDDIIIKNVNKNELNDIMYNLLKLNKIEDINTEFKNPDLLFLDNLRFITLIKNLEVKFIVHSTLNVVSSKLHSSLQKYNMKGISTNIYYFTFNNFILNNLCFVVGEFVLLELVPHVYFFVPQKIYEGKTANINQKNKCRISNINGKSKFGDNLKNNLELLKNDLKQVVMFLDGFLNQTTSKDNIFNNRVDSKKNIQEDNYNETSPQNSIITEKTYQTDGECFLVNNKSNKYFTLIFNAPNTDTTCLNSINKGDIAGNNSIIDLNIFCSNPNNVLDTFNLKNVVIRNLLRLIIFKYNFTETFNDLKILDGVVVGYLFNKIIKKIYGSSEATSYKIRSRRYILYNTVVNQSNNEINTTGIKIDSKNNNSLINDSKRRKIIKTQKLSTINYKSKIYIQPIKKEKKLSELKEQNSKTTISKHYDCFIDSSYNNTQTKLIINRLEWIFLMLEGMSSEAFVIKIIGELLKLYNTIDISLSYLNVKNVRCSTNFINFNSFKNICQNISGKDLERFFNFYYKALNNITNDTPILPKYNNNLLYVLIFNYSIEPKKSVINLWLDQQNLSTINNTPDTFKITDSKIFNTMYKLNDVVKFNSIEQEKVYTHTFDLSLKELSFLYHSRSIKSIRGRCIELKNFLGVSIDPSVEYMFESKIINNFNNYNVNLNDNINNIFNINHMNVLNVYKDNIQFTSDSKKNLNDVTPTNSNYLKDIDNIFLLISEQLNGKTIILENEGIDNLDYNIKLKLLNYKENRNNMVNGLNNNIIIDDIYKSVDNLNTSNTFNSSLNLNGTSVQNEAANSDTFNNSNLEIFSDIDKIFINRSFDIMEEKLYKDEVNYFTKLNIISIFSNYDIDRLLHYYIKKFCIKKSSICKYPNNVEDVILLDGIIKSIYFSNALNLNSFNDFIIKSDGVETKNNKLKNNFIDGQVDVVLNEVLNKIPAEIKDESNHPPKLILSFLKSLLTTSYSNLKYDNTLFLCYTIISLGIYDNNKNNSNNILDVINSYFYADLLLPSHNNRIFTSCLDFYYYFALKNYLYLKIDVLIYLTQNNKNRSNSINVRKKSIDGILLNYSILFNNLFIHVNKISNIEHNDFFNLIYDFLIIKKYNYLKQKDYNITLTIKNKFINLTNIENIKKILFDLQKIFIFFNYMFYKSKDLVLSNYLIKTLLELYRVGMYKNFVLSEKYLINIIHNTNENTKNCIGKMKDDMMYNNIKEMLKIAFNINLDKLYQSFDVDSNLLSLVGKSSIKTSSLDKFNFIVLLKINKIPRYIIKLKINNLLRVNTKNKKIINPYLNDAADLQSSKSNKSRKISNISKSNNNIKGSKSSSLSSKANETVKEKYKSKEKQRKEQEHKEKNKYIYKNARFMSSMRRKGILVENIIQKNVFGVIQLKINKIKRKKVEIDSPKFEK